MNYSIPRPNTQATQQHIDESLDSIEHSVAHTTSMLERIALLANGTLQNCERILPKGIGPMQLNTSTLYCTMPKSALDNMATLLQHTKGKRRIFAPPTMWSMNYLFILP